MSPPPKLCLVVDNEPEICHSVYPPLAQVEASGGGDQRGPK
jgi:hypothetical protein